MKTATGISAGHQKVYDRIFQHPMPHNLQWREVWSMLRALPEVNAVEEKDGNFKLTSNGQTLVLHRPQGKDLADNDELARLRSFLQRSAPAAEPAVAAGMHLLVVIDHREARIYRAEVRGSAPQRITPYDPFGFGRALHYNEDDANGKRKPELKSFYEAVAKTLQGAQQILLFGTGTGASSAMEQLLLDLKKNHHDLSKRVVGSIAVDEHHLTDDQLLAKARQLFVVT
jgi:hypothetical protein